MIYFIRHGETDYNKEHRLQGHLDIPLNEKGIAQAEKARDELANFHFDIIYSSPLKRAKKTAEIINEKHGVEIIVDERIKEVFCGNVQGKSLKDWTEEMHQELHNFPERFGAEGIVKLCSRVEDFYKEIENSEKDILIVAHGGVYRALYRYLNNLDWQNFHFKGIENAKAVRIK